MASSNKDLIKGGIGSLVAKALYVLFSFGAGVVLARTLGVAEFGEYALAMSLVTIVVVPAQLGFKDFVLRWTAVYRSAGDVAAMKGLWQVSLGATAFAGVLLGAILVLLVGGATSSPPREFAAILVYASLLIPLLAVLSVAGGAVRGLGYVVVGQLPEQIIRPCLFLLGAVIFATSDNWTAEVAMILNTVAAAIALITGLFLVFLLRPRMMLTVKGQREPVRWLNQAFPFMLLTGTQLINHQADLIMLGILTSEYQVGQYRVALHIVDGAGMILLALTAMIAPHLARLHTEGDRASIRKLLVGCHRIGFCILAPVVGVVSLYSEEFLEVLFGMEYMPVAASMVVLLFGKLIYSSVGFAGTALSMFGMAKAATVVTAITIALNVLLNLLLIPRYESYGAAISTSISSVAVAAACIFWMWIKFRVNYSMFGTLKGSQK